MKLGPPGTYRQNETPTWVDCAWIDEQGVTRSSPTYALAYIIAGPATGPITLTSTALNGGWTTTLDPTNSAKLSPGKYWWQAVLTGTSYRRVIGEGELTIEADLALQGTSSNFDGRTVAEIALANWEKAGSALTQGMTKSYSIGDRHMTFFDLPHVTEMIDYWRGRVNGEKSAASNGRDRFILQKAPRHV